MTMARSTVPKTVRFMLNVLTIAEIKRRGIAAIEEGLRKGPLHILKRNRAAAVVLSEAEYQRLVQGQARPPEAGRGALAWLLGQPNDGVRSRASIDQDLHADRDW
jgi:hypothetical protein